MSRDEKRLLKYAIKEAYRLLDQNLEKKRRLERLEFVEHNVHHRDLAAGDASDLLDATLNIVQYTDAIADLKERLRGR